MAGIGVEQFKCLSWHKFCFWSLGFSSGILRLISKNRQEHFFRVWLAGGESVFGGDGGALKLNEGKYDKRIFVCCHYLIK